jgi:hypothetical protein
MSNYISTTFGRIIGKHGTAVGAIREGKAVLRIFTPPSNPNSVKQQTQRMKFGLVLSSMKPLRKAITIGFGSKRCFYQAISLALNSAVSGVFPHFTFDYSKVKVSSGLLAQGVSAKVSLLAGNLASVEWTPDVWAGGSANDMLYVVFLDSATGIAKFDLTGVTRQNGKFTVELSAAEPGSTFHVWLFFSDATQCSNSQYLGTVVTV